MEIAISLIYSRLEVLLDRLTQQVSIGKFNVEEQWRRATASTGSTCYVLYL